MFSSSARLIRLLVVFAGGRRGRTRNQFRGCSNRHPLGKIVDELIYCVHCKQNLEKRSLEGALLYFNDTFHYIRHIRDACMKKRVLANKPVFDNAFGDIWDFFLNYEFL